jgi:hypothetical protein
MGQARGAAVEYAAALKQQAEALGERCAELEAREAEARARAEAAEAERQTLAEEVSEPLAGRSLFFFARSWLEIEAKANPCSRCCSLCFLLGDGPAGETSGNGDHNGCLRHSPAS